MNKQQVPRTVYWPATSIRISDGLHITPAKVVPFKTICAPVSTHPHYPREPPNKRTSLTISSSAHKHKHLHTHRSPYVRTHTPTHGPMVRTGTLRIAGIMRRTRALHTTIHYPYAQANIMCIQMSGWVLERGIILSFSLSLARSLAPSLRQEEMSLKLFCARSGIVRGGCARVMFVLSARKHTKTAYTHSHAAHAYSDE